MDADALFKTITPACQSDDSTQAYFAPYKLRHSVILSWDRNGDWKP